MGERRAIQPSSFFAFSTFGSPTVTIHGYQTRYHPVNVKNGCFSGGETRQLGGN